MPRPDSINISVLAATIRIQNEATVTTEPGKMRSTTLTLSDGVHIVVPDSLTLITPYVLREQRDWFEDEIMFVRHLLRPGQHAIDIGANYGTYTLTIAKAIGRTGHVWAFEPASSTYQLLGQSVTANELSNVTIEKAALSSTTGTGVLSLDDNSELNALVRNESAASNSESVRLTTLDECLTAFGWHDIDFMKIDAEGEESNILKGGKDFFSRLSPLVQYEVKAGKDVHMELVREFESIGYDSYRLVPGLNMLAPATQQMGVDGYLLNLFCCKSDRRDKLAASGFLIAPSKSMTEEGLKNAIGDPDSPYGWRHTIARLPYGEVLLKYWETTTASNNKPEVEEALALYAMSRDSTRSAAERFRALETSFHKLKGLCETQSSYLRLASLARVARDYGARSIAVSALGELGNRILQQGVSDPTEPFLAPIERFDIIQPGAAVGEWVLAAILEGYEKLSSFSSFYTGMSARQRLEIIRNLGFGSDEMQRRLELVSQRFRNSQQ